MSPRPWRPTAFARRVVQLLGLSEKFADDPALLGAEVEAVHRGGVDDQSLGQVGCEVVSDVLRVALWKAAWVAPFLPAAGGFQLHCEAGVGGELGHHRGVAVAEGRTRRGAADRDRASDAILGGQWGGQDRSDTG